MKRTLLSLSLLVSGLSFAQDCSELFISEYLEGYGTNKALEIFNPTNASIDLSQYIVIRYSNGSSNATSANAVQLNGTIGSKDVYVAAIDKRNPNGTGNNSPIDSLLLNLSDGFYCPVYNTSNAFYWNGNDAVVLAKGSVNDIANSTAVDIFGKIGENPGNGSDPEDGWTSESPYTGAGDGVTVNHLMIRKSTVLKGVTNPQISFFNPLAEYDSLPAPKYLTGGVLSGTYNSLGYHTCGCGTTPVADVKENGSLEISIFPNPSNGNFIIKGEVESVKVINALGQKVEANIQKSGKLTNVNIERRKGLYFVQVLGINGQEVTERVIIK